MASMSPAHPPTWLLSIHEDSNANATLFRDGRPIFAVAEERLNRRKFAAGFPRLSVAACLDFAGISLQDVDVIVPGNKHHFLPRVTDKLLPGGEHDYFGPAHKAWLYVQQQMSRPGPVAWATERLSGMLLKRRLPRVADFVDHHTAHAYSAWLTSGKARCVAVTSDNMGDGWASKVFACEPEGMRFLHGSTALHSAGQFYGEIAQLLGFHNLNAGKVTGLAAHGDPDAAYAIVAELFSCAADKRSFITPPIWSRTRGSGPYKKLKAHTARDIAAATQRRLEDVMVDYVQHAVREAGCGDVVLAGGTFANVVVNQRILQLPEVDSVYIHPAMTDQGISMGAGLAHLHAAGCEVNTELASIYLGPGPSEAACERALTAQGLPFTRPDDIATAAAELLRDRNVVVRCAGRMEYGPRALGNRSIMYRADDPSVNNWLNHKLDRTEFMPFAPVTLADHVGDCYVDFEGGELAARYMTITFGVADIMRERSPGVVHLDGTARPQLVSAEDNPGYHAILSRYHELTGVPTLINTSFNMHGEPIVCSADDAVRAFVRSRLPWMVLGPFLVQGPARGRGEAS